MFLYIDIQSQGSVWANPDIILPQTCLHPCSMQYEKFLARGPFPTGAVVQELDVVSCVGSNIGSAAPTPKQHAKPRVPRVRASRVPCSPLAQSMGYYLVANSHLMKMAPASMLYPSLVCTNSVHICQDGRGSTITIAETNSPLYIMGAIST